MPRSHPRYKSLYYRDLLVDGVEKGIVSLQGLIAHGRGETFDYLLGEKTHSFAKKASKAAAALLVLAEYPVLSVNGNTAVLVPKEFVRLAHLLGAKLEVNLFHSSKNREKRIAAQLKKYGAKEVLLSAKVEISGIESNRRFIAEKGQAKADVVFVPLEDGDRTEALVTMGKKVITVDLNPLSRTAQRANITIVDNIVRVMPLIINQVKNLRGRNRKKLVKIVADYNNDQALIKAERLIRGES